MLVVVPVYLSYYSVEVVPVNLIKGVTTNFMVYTFIDIIHVMKWILVLIVVVGQEEFQVFRSLW